MKKSFLFLAVLLVPVFALAQWRTIFNDSTIDWRDVFFLNGKVGFVAGQTQTSGSNKGIIMKTTDGGQSWSNLFTMANAVFFGISFINDNIGFSTAEEDEKGSSVILKTHDGGITWDSCLYGDWNTYHGFQHIQFINDSVGYITSSTTLFKTTDSGKNWVICYNVSIDYSLIGDIYFLNADTGMISVFDNDNKSYISSTVDGGVHWKKILVSTGIYTGFSCVWSKNINQLFALDDVDHIFISSDAGDSWNEFPVGEFPNYSDFNDMILVDDTLGWIASGHGLFQTQDGGETWRNIDSIYLSRMNFPSSDTGYAVGGGHILKYVVPESIATGINESTADYFFFYPNPASTELNIRFLDTMSGNALISVADLSGRTLEFKKISAGKSNLNFELQRNPEISSGLYLLKIETAKQSFQKLFEIQR